jgi:hypothetical protein
VYANALTASAPPLPVGRGGATARICACVGRQVDSRRNEDDDHVFTPLIFTPLTLCLATRSGRSSAPADDDDESLMTTMKQALDVMAMMMEGSALPPQMGFQQPLPVLRKARRLRSRTLPPLLRRAAPYEETLPEIQQKAICCAINCVQNIFVCNWFCINHK